MKRNGRPEDPVFGGSEKLFRRYKSEHIVNGSFTGVGLSFKNAPSLNRENYSEPKDVLFSETDEFANWGVVSFRVQEIPSPLPPDNPRYNVSPKHIPLEDNYAHTEVHCEGIPAAGYVEPTPAIRKFLRATLGQRIRVEIESRI
jgi:hypothetical protein